MEGGEGRDAEIARHLAEFRAMHEAIECLILAVLRPTEKFARDRERVHAFVHDPQAVEDEVAAALSRAGCELRLLYWLFEPREDGESDEAYLYVIYRFPLGSPKVSRESVDDALRQDGLFDVVRRGLIRDTGGMKAGERLWQFGRREGQ